MGAVPTLPFLTLFLDIVLVTCLLIAVDSHHQLSNIVQVILKRVATVPLPCYLQDAPPSEISLSLEHLMREFEHRPRDVFGAVGERFTYLLLDVGQVFDVEVLFTVLGEGGRFGQFLVD